MGAHAAFGAFICAAALITINDVLIWALDEMKLSGFVQPYDDTDDPRGTRSNMGLLRDHGTGCQYLRVRGSGITPRLNPDGTQVCTRKETAPR
jgi:hypothetical protein